MVLDQSVSALAHMISYDTNLSLGTILLFITAKLAAAVTEVAPLVHPGTVLGDHVTTTTSYIINTSGITQLSPDLSFLC